MQIEFVDLKSQYNSIKEEIKEALSGVLESTSFIQGPSVFSFEKDFAKYLAAGGAACVNSGTSALYCVLRALEIAPGDEVITVPNSFFATAEAISMAGAKPVFVDVEPDTYLMDANKLESAITDKTRVIIPVHLFGQCADMDRILEVAKKYDLYVIEDACQAHGAEYRGKKAGTIGDAGCFSFYPGKNLGAYGEGGAVVSNNEELTNRVKMIRNHGGIEKYRHSLTGGNFRMDGFQGAVLGVKLKYLDKWTEARRKNVEQYNELLKGLPIQLPVELKHNKHIYHLFVIRTEKRDELMKRLNDNGIATGIHYPIPIHLQKAYEGCGWNEGDYPVAEKAAGEILSLPMYPELSGEQINYICENIKICRQ
ncbi:MAG: DegT/DnrJ/EryC1/StrS family aminotransferase [Elusimicrobia bacterium]|nr:DegT/DnrJ/EryC1/StrS family aminotransferase [Elusimicrobiota bacterium]